jgi:hypothetical protein
MLSHRVHLVGRLLETSRCSAARLPRPRHPAAPLVASFTPALGNKSAGSVLDCNGAACGRETRSRKTAGAGVLWRGRVGPWPFED